MIPMKKLLFALPILLATLLFAVAPLAAHERNSEDGPTAQGKPKPTPLPNPKPAGPPKSGDE
jgi:hypothetical protein